MTDGKNTDKNTDIILTQETVQLIKKVHEMSGDVSRGMESIQNELTEFKKDTKCELKKIVDKLPQITTNKDNIARHEKSHDKFFTKTVAIITLVVIVINFFTGLLFNSKKFIDLCAKAYAAKVEKVNHE